ncbi:hypothetical protein SK128_016385, partial [Halocaridina rubra]
STVRHLPPVKEVTAAMALGLRNKRFSFAVSLFLIAKVLCSENATHMADSSDKTKSFLTDNATAESEISRTSQLFTEISLSQKEEIHHGIQSTTDFSSTLIDNITEVEEEDESLPYPCKVYAPGEILVDVPAKISLQTDMPMHFELELINTSWNTTACLSVINEFPYNFFDISYTVSLYNGNCSGTALETKKLLESSLGEWLHMTLGYKSDDHLEVSAIINGEENLLFNRKMTDVSGKLLYISSIYSDEPSTKFNCHSECTVWETNKFKELYKYQRNVKNSVPFFIKPKQSPVRINTAVKQNCAFQDRMVVILGTVIPPSDNQLWTYVNVTLDFENHVTLEVDGQLKDSVHPEVTYCSNSISWFMTFIRGEALIADISCDVPQVRNHENESSSNVVAE